MIFRNIKNLIKIIFILNIYVILIYNINKKPIYVKCNLRTL